MTPSTSNTHRVFVYGSLKKGYGNNGILKSSTFVGNDYIEGFVMISRGYFPAIFKVNDPYNRVYGEVYDVDDTVLEALDRLEGVSYNHYQRVKVPLVRNQGESYVYIQDPPKFDCERVIGGTWLGESKSNLIWLRIEHVAPLLPGYQKPLGIEHEAKSAIPDYKKWESQYTKDPISEFISGGVGLPAATAAAEIIEQEGGAATV